MKDSNIKVIGLPEFYENTHIEFTNDGLILSVGLNVEEKISKILHFNKLITGFSGKVYKGTDMFVYRYYKKIPSQHISIQTIKLIQNELLKLVQIDINKAKSMYYQSVSEQIKKLI